MVWFMKCIWYSYDEYMVRYMMGIYYGIRWVYDTGYDEYMVWYTMGMWYGI